MKNVDLSQINLTKLSKLDHKSLVDLAQKMKYQNNKTIDRLLFRYSKQLKELNINYIRDRITQDTSDEKLLMYIQDAYDNLTLGGGGKLSAKELKDVKKYERSLVDLDDEEFNLLYDEFLSLSTDEQIEKAKFEIIGSAETYNANLFTGSRVTRAKRFIEYIKEHNLEEKARQFLT